MRSTKVCEGCEHFSSSVGFNSRGVTDRTCWCLAHSLWDDKFNERGDVKMFPFLPPPKACPMIMEHIVLTQRKIAE